MGSKSLGNILIYGAGSVGIALGASIYSQGKDITFLARGETLQAIRDDGIKRTGMFGELEANAGEVRAVSSMEELAEHSIDLVLVCTKTLANEEAAATLFPRTGTNWLIRQRSSFFKMAGETTGRFLRAFPRR